ncbi:hypothetical protein Tco_0735403 [Tanacetum coccineum]
MLEDGTEFHMLAERKSLLTKETLEKMLVLRLTAESESEATFDLLRLVLLVEDFVAAEVLKNLLQVVVESQNSRSTALVESLQAVETLQWENILTVGSSSNSGNHSTNSGNPLAFYSQQSSPKLDTSPSYQVSRIK